MQRGLKDVDELGTHIVDYGVSMQRGLKVIYTGQNMSTIMTSLNAKRIESPREKDLGLPIAEIPSQCKED